MSQPTRAGIVIIGGGQAGGWAAKTLRDRGYSGRLSVISDEPYDFYERPPLSKAALLDGSAPLSRLFSEEVVAGMNIDWYRPLRAEAIDGQQQIVTLSDGSQLQFDQLLIATGGRPRLPDANWAKHPRVMTLRSWDDAARLRQGLQQCQKLAIVGGGWIGLEIAASARKLGVDVTVFERQPALCMRSVGAGVSQALLELHQQQGVTVHCDCGEITLEDREGEAWIGSASSAAQPFDLVVVGIGVELNLELAHSAGLKLEGGIVVDGQGRTSHPAIFAAGDVARHPTLGLCLQSWAYAQNQAISTACAMLDAFAAPYDDVAWLWSDQYDANIQILGVPTGGVHQIVRRTPQSQLFFTLNADRQLVQLVAFNDARTIKLGKRWLASGRVLDPQQLADVEFSLMALK
ncbi:MULTISPECIES: NAD(P)/FAD-dependent oxidoreductase [Serratia]|uniref:NAD(P)/FAD-dependent oxidoreductase n=1 Tax=Serratia TaxID=613 RepID=UPI00192CB4CD|nr:FAD-dependent oxidoreductase [Serratia fonticola]MBL5828129.1 FAD-dependent oxidoreductase [Serratia fonticola]MBL5903224.1 FAD-dependent oxidoreductase [Serratia fonticola]CAI0839133.1 Rhodocoxin reductase [Serratia fonticola]CAI0876013.1 Rhodocoxin reductase [Serratia fonticola]CAI0984740.1 Rhodocoxin reductase [Serratia fonticola]